MDGEKPRRGLNVKAIATALIVLVIGCLTLARRERVAPLNGTLIFDDFAFTVKDAERIPPSSGSNGSALYVITLNIANRAKRVDYHFHRQNAVLIDRHGRRYQPLPRAKDEGDPCGGAIKAGSSCTTELKYEVPADVTDPRFSLSFGPVGDFLESLVAGRNRFELK